MTINAGSNTVQSFGTNTANMYPTSSSQEFTDIAQPFQPHYRIKNDPGENKLQVAEK
jgi:hypothetical protein